jgi:hypothetical protein
MLHDPHKNPEPVLVVSGLTYLIPFYMAVRKERAYDATTYLCLTLTTVGFHSTRDETLFALDCLAILNFLYRSYILSTERSRFCQRVYFLSVIYSLVSYFVGRQYSIFSFHPDWNTQMFFHSLMHLSTSYSSYLIMNEVV